MYILKCTWYILCCTEYIHVYVRFCSFTGLLITTTFGCVEWELELRRGVMRARCCPFDMPKHHFHGFNPKVWVHTCYMNVHTWYIHVCNMYIRSQYVYIHSLYWNIHVYNLTSGIIVCRTPSLLSLSILTALRRFPKMFPWKTVGMLAPSSSLPATCVQRIAGSRRICITNSALMTSFTSWSSSAPLRSSSCPSESVGLWIVLG